MSDFFWNNLKKPIFGLSPMDGVTDAAYRFIVAKYAKPSVMFTEFVSVEGLVSGADILMNDFMYSEIERPIVAQVFGTDSEAFYKVSGLVCELGFDGLDINMGCPDKNVAKRGGGAALIQNPKLAKEIIRKTKEGVRDWAEGKKIEDFGFSKEILDIVKFQKNQEGVKHTQRKEIPVSVKTRIGFDKVDVEPWVESLLEESPACISLHGRTLKQMYTGKADWEAIARAEKIIHKTDTLLLGNGDVKTKKQAEEKVEKYRVDGVLVGRAFFGYPWIFSENEPDFQGKLRVAIEHAKIYENIFKDRKFYIMKKHLAWYAHGFVGAKELRIKLMKAESSKDCEREINDFLSK